MNHKDARGLAVTGATPRALDSFELAVARLMAWRSGAETALDEALREAPGFTMAHVMRASMLVCSRDPQRVRAAAPVLSHAASLPANAREAGHLGAITAVLNDDYPGARECLQQLLHKHPRDILALHVANSLDYLMGDVVSMHGRVASVFPAWSTDDPGYHALLSMHAFSLVENGETGHGEDAARAALGMNPMDARAHHAMAHVFETGNRAEAGLRWMLGHAHQWADGSLVVTHGWWHVALFHLDLGQIDRALAVYDHHVRVGFSTELSDLIDAASLLWRAELRGGDVGRRWTELAGAWALHVTDAYCSFSDVHAMVAFVGARDWQLARKLESALMAERTQPTRHGATTRQLGLDASRALIAYAQGNLAAAITLLARLPSRVQTLGGSHAQRDVLHLTLLQAVEQIRRPRAGARMSPMTAAALASDASTSPSRSLPAAPSQSGPRPGSRSRSHARPMSMSMAVSLP